MRLSVMEERAPPFDVVVFPDDASKTDAEPTRRSENAPNVPSAPIHPPSTATVAPSSATVTKPSRNAFAARGEGEGSSVSVSAVSKSSIASLRV